MPHYLMIPQDSKTASRSPRPSKMIYIRTRSEPISKGKSWCPSRGGVRGLEISAPQAVVI